MFWLLIVLYAIGFVVFCRFLVMYHAYEFKLLKWEKDDTIACIFFGSVWPVSGLLILLAWIIGMLADRQLDPFKRWHKKFRDNAQ